MKFRPNNKYLYMQDFRVLVGIPSGVDWIITKGGVGYILISPGYGEVGSYGNGSLRVYPKTKFQAARLEAGTGATNDHPPENHKKS